MHGLVTYVPAGGDEQKEMMEFDPTSVELPPKHSVEVNWLPGAGLLHDSKTASNPRVEIVPWMHSDLMNIPEVTPWVDETEEHAATVPLLAELPLTWIQGDV